MDIKTLWQAIVTELQTAFDAEGIGVNCKRMILTFRNGQPNFSLGANEVGVYLAPDENPYTLSEAESGQPLGDFLRVLFIVHAQGATDGDLQFDSVIKATDIYNLIKKTLRTIRGQSILGIYPSIKDYMLLEAKADKAVATFNTYASYEV